MLPGLLELSAQESISGNLKLAFYGGLDLLCGLPELSAQESISRNLKLPFYQVGQMCHLVCLSCSEHKNLLVGISNWPFCGRGRSAVLVCLSSQSMNLSVGISNWHFVGGVDVAPGLPEFSAVGIYQQESQIDILWEGYDAVTWPA